MTFMLQRASLIDNLTEDGHALTQKPYPFYVTEEGAIERQDFWQGQVSRVVGFQRDLYVQQIDLWWRDAVIDPSSTVGMYVVTADKHGDFAVHTTAVEHMTELTECPECKRLTGHKMDCSRGR